MAVPQDALPRSMPKLTITIDGPAGSGKSSVARLVASLLGYSYLDSGAMYRALALKALERRVALNYDARLEALAKETHIELKPPTPECETVGAKNRVFLDGREVTNEIRTADAVLVDNTSMGIEETARLIVMLADERQKEAASTTVSPRDRR